MLHMCLFTIYKIEIFIYGSAHAHRWHVYIYIYMYIYIYTCIYIYIYTCMGYIFAFVPRSTNWRMHHHGVFCTLSTVGLKSLLGLASIERVMPSGCMTGSWFYNDIRCNHSRVEIVQSYLQQDTLRDGRCLLRHEFEWILMAKTSIQSVCVVESWHCMHWNMFGRRSMSDITVCVAAQCAGIWWGWSMNHLIGDGKRKENQGNHGNRTNMSY